MGVTTLKKVCRVNSIGRWPFRKRSSLNRLIQKTREYFAADPQQCAEALAQLEAQRSVLRVSPSRRLPVRRRLARHGLQPAEGRRPQPPARPLQKTAPAVWLLHDVHT